MRVAEQNHRKGKKMSILIKEMAIPKSCGECPLEQLYGRDCETAKCPITKNLDSAYRVSQARMFGCPLVELPPHGRLIDADALTTVTEMVNGEFKTYIEEFEINDAPTIIESEKEDG